MDQADTDTISVEIRVEGRVQGVGYRVNARRKAAELGIDAEPVNLDDGTVRIRASGPRDAIERFIAWCHDGPRLAEVTRVTVTDHR